MRRGPLCTSCGKIDHALRTFLFLYRVLEAFARGPELLCEQSSPDEYKGGLRYCSAIYEGIGRLGAQSVPSICNGVILLEVMTQVMTHF